MERECSDATYGDAINVSVRYLPDPTAHRLSKDVQLIKPDDTIRSAAALMKKIDAGLLPVTENDRVKHPTRKSVTQ